MRTMSIPYEIANFEEMRKRGFYYVDKTKYISELEGYKAPVFCVRVVLAKVYSALPFRVTTTNATKMLEDMLNYVRRNNLPPLYIIIDEYDNFTNQLLTAYKDPLNEEVTTSVSFLPTFFKVIKKGIGEGECAHLFLHRCATCYDGRPHKWIKHGRDTDTKTAVPQYIPGTEFYKDDRIVEFKYFKSGDAKKTLALNTPYEKDVEQVKEYAAAVKKQFTNFNVRTFVAYIVSNKGYRFWEA